MNHTLHHTLHHTFDADLATELHDVNLAILLHHFQYWIRHNNRLKRNFHEGRTWMYETYEEIEAHFPYWSRDQIKRLLLKSVKLKILRKGNFNRTQFDRTVWYAFENEEKFTIGRNRPMDRTKAPDGSDEIARPIPDSKQIDKQEERKESTKETSAQAPSAHSFSKKIERAEHVATSEADHTKLIDKLDPEGVEDCYRFLSQWKEDSSKSKWKKSDYRSILRWVIDAVREKKLKKQKEGKTDERGSLIEENRKWAQFLRKVDFPVNNQYIKLDEHCVYFCQGRERIPFGYSEANFREVIENKLRNWEIPISGQH